MSEDLVGFLLGSLDEDERRRIESRLERDEGLRTELHRVDRQVDILRWDRQVLPAPPGLAERTCQLVAARAAAIAAPVRLSAGYEPPLGTYRTWNVSDLVVAAGIFFAVACLFFPALTNSRFHARLLQCQQNLHELGTKLSQYSLLVGGHFPEIPSQGNAGVAGIYAVKLFQRQLLSDPRILLCPNDDRCGSQLVIPITVPSPQQLEEAQGRQLIALHQNMGGSYAYVLGFQEQGRLRPVRNLGRKHFVIMADAPLEHGRSFRGPHDSGQNVLFEDGHVAFLRSPFRPGRPDDNIFLNDDGLVEAGLHPEDAVVAPSATRPLLRTGGIRSQYDPGATRRR